MRYCVGIDLGSTTTKAVVLGDDGTILGRGITNSRSNYKVACDVALAEALIAARFGILARRLEETGIDEPLRRDVIQRFELLFRRTQYRGHLRTFSRIILRLAGADAASAAAHPILEEILARMDAESDELFSAHGTRKSDFFRDLAGSRYLAIAEEIAKSGSVSFDRLVGLFDKAILEAENVTVDEESFGSQAREALAGLTDSPPEVACALEAAARVRLERIASVGTGYGRQTLPFPKEQIRSEILCHGLGAHAMFPATRTVLDIGGQDTKAIQVDEEGIVTSFQMNDRCAAGCGRYLGYIADEMNLGLHQLGPMAMKAERPVRINSTCTVFAGAELRERLSLGERREDILAGLHRAIILRAMSLLARSGGIADQFTFTGGVARNPAAVDALSRLVEENYGKVVMNISPDSIYTGALGAALFAHRRREREPEGARG
jgi:benzoyl-CoA reductase subunit A